MSTSAIKAEHQHTPGPWHVRTSVARYLHIHSASVDNIACTRRTGDANLIAAAPDLLAALTEMLEEYGNETRWPTGEVRHGAKDILTNARAAIAKAEGRA